MYMAPEQALGHEIGPWTDLYSVGVMAWEHVVGEAPFRDTEAAVMILARHVNEQIPLATDLNPDIDPNVSDWIDRLLGKRSGRTAEHSGGCMGRSGRGRHRQARSTLAARGVTAASRRAGGCPTRPNTRAV